MSKFIHVSEEDGKVTVEPGVLRQFPGWVYEVPNNYKLVRTMQQFEEKKYIYELLDDDERAIQVREPGEQS